MIQNELNDLIDRYIYAAAKGLPTSSKNDIQKELKTLILDMLEERCEEMVPTEKDLKVIFAELGTPAELAENYSPDNDKNLIGPPYFSKYKMVLKIVLLSTALGMIIASSIAFLIDKSNTQWLVGAVEIVGSTLSGMIYAFAFVTLLFIFFQRKEIRLEQFTEDINHLPPVPKKQEEIKRPEILFELGLAVVELIVLLLTPQIICGVFIDSGSSTYNIIPVFDIFVIRNCWYLIIGFFIFAVIKGLFKLYEGRYTKRLAVVTIFTNFCTWILTYLFISASNLMNPQFLAVIRDTFSAEDEVIVKLFSNFPKFIFICITVAILLDIVTVLVKAYKYSGAESRESS